MSGHSHWATTKRAKGAKDAARGKLFSKLAKSISLAAKSGSDPDANPRLRMAITEAKNANMPKDNIERAIARASRKDVQLEELTYEGFGPDGVNIIVEAASDNRNRTAQEIKNIFEKSGGTMAGPGSVSFNFEPAGYIVVEKIPDPQDEVLKIIDLGVEEVEETSDVIEVFVPPSDVATVKESIEKLGYKVKSIDLIKKPKNYMFISDNDSVKKVMALLENLEEHDDVQKVFTNADIPGNLTH